MRAVTGRPASHELGVFSLAEMSNQYGEVGRHGGPDGQEVRRCRRPEDEKAETSGRG